jgi:hypothetical protein
VPLFGRLSSQTDHNQPRINVGLEVTDNPTSNPPTWTTVWGTNIANSGQAFSIGPTS